MTDTARRLAARDQLPRGDTWCTSGGALAALPGNQAGAGQVMMMHSPPGTVPHQALGGLSSSDLGSAQNAGPTEPGLCGVPANLNLGSLDLWSACNPGPALDSSPSEHPGV